LASLVNKIESVTRTFDALKPEKVNRLNKLQVDDVSLSLKTKMDDEAATAKNLLLTEIDVPKVVERSPPVGAGLTFCTNSHLSVLIFE
jgi:hypothetical protein